MAFTVNVVLLPPLTLTLAGNALVSTPAVATPVQFKATATLLPTGTLTALPLLSLRLTV